MTSQNQQCFFIIRDAYEYETAKNLDDIGCLFDGLFPFEFPKIDNPNGFVSLSHFVPAQNDPTNGQWKLNVKYGKLSGERATAANPFKRPVIMLTPGSWFHPGDVPKLWYGRVVEGVSPQFSDVVQYGLAFAVPIQLP